MKKALSNTKSFSVNSQAWKLLEVLLRNAEGYGVKFEESKTGALIVDAGVNAEGGFEAGRIITEICMGGCGKTELTVRDFGDLSLTSIQVHSDMPVLATLGSQYAGWQINEKGYFAIGSGPARALAQKPKKIYREIGYKDDFDRGIVVLETQKKPPESLIRRFADECHISTGNLAILLTPTTSVAGATQISGRVVETGIHKLRRLGLDSNKITHAFGYAPIPSIHPKFTVAMARTNDAILYGGFTYYIVKDETDENLKKFVEKAPSLTSPVYGKPFLEIFKEAQYDFYKIDPNLFAPASITMNNAVTGSIFQSGRINAEALKESFSIS